MATSRAAASDRTLMLVVTARYTWKPGCYFDEAYYRMEHAARARNLLAAHGLVELECIVNVPSTGQRRAGEHVALSRACFNTTVADPGTTIGTVIARLTADLAAYTSIVPVLEVAMEPAVSPPSRGHV